MEEGANNNEKKRYAKHHPLAFVGMVFVCLVSWVTGYLFSIGFPVYGGVNASPLWGVICWSLPGKEITYLIGLLLVAGGAFLLHRINYVLALIREKTYLPFFFYALLISSSPRFFPLTPASFGVFFLIVALYFLFMSYHDENARSASFKACFIIGLGSLLWVQILWFVPLFWFGMSRFRLLNVKTFLASLAGLVTIYWFLLGWCVWSYNFTPFTQLLPSLLNVQIVSFSDMVWEDWLAFAFISAMNVLAAFNILFHEYNSTQQTRQSLSFLILFEVWSILLFFLFESSADEFLLVACIPSSILLAHFFTLEHRKLVLWLFYFTLVFFAALIFFRLWDFL